MSHPIDRYAYWIEAALSYYEDAEDLRMSGNTLHRLACLLYARAARAGLNAMAAATDIQPDETATHLSALLRQIEPVRADIATANLHADARTLTRVLQLDRSEVGDDLLVRDLFDQEMVDACRMATTRILGPIVKELLGKGLEEAQLRFAAFRAAPMISSRLWQRRHPHGRR
jgi:hypothetical protein